MRQNLIIFEKQNEQILVVFIMSYLSFLFLQNEEVEMILHHVVTRVYHILIDILFVTLFFCLVLFTFFPPFLSNAYTFFFFLLHSRGYCSYSNDVFTYFVSFMFLVACRWFFLLFIPRYDSFFFLSFYRLSFCSFFPTRVHHRSTTNKKRVQIVCPLLSIFFH